MGTWVNVLKSHLHLVIPVSYLCHTNLCPDLSQKRAHTHTTHTHTHSHTHTHTHTHSHIPAGCFKWKQMKSELFMLVCLHVKRSTEAWPPVKQNPRTSPWAAALLFLFSLQRRVREGRSPALPHTHYFRQQHKRAAHSASAHSLHPQHLIHWHPRLRCFCVMSIQAMFSAETHK